MCRSDSVPTSAALESSFWMRGRSAFMPAWEDDWFRNLILTSVLVALILLMVGSIYLASTRPAAPSTPETGTACSGSSAFVQVTAEPFSIPTLVSVNPVAEA